MRPVGQPGEVERQPRKIRLMESISGQALEREAMAELMTLGIEAELEPTVSSGFRVPDEVDGRSLRADAVLLVQGRLVALVEIVAQDRPDLRKAHQLLRLASLLGAPLALLRTPQGWFHVFEGLPTLTGEGDLVRQSSLAFGSVRSISLQRIDLRVRVRQLVRVLNLATRPPICQVVDQAVSEWKRGGGSRPAATSSAALAYYHSEFMALCAQASLPLSQCVLIGGLFEAVLQDFTAVKRIAVPPKPTPGRRPSKKPGRVPKPTLGVYLKEVQRHGYLSGSVRGQTPKVIVDSRNRLHPAVFSASPVVGRAVAANSADVLLWAVQQLNPVI